ncbi:hypothetical protein K432DRAFT_326441, partial [Lepidopterella palustris CBS 459.81]
MATSTSYETLFKSAREAAPKSLPEDAWYIIVAATLITADGGAHVADLYQFLIKELGSNSSQEDRRRVSRRLRAIIMKAWTLVGMPRASDALFALKKVEAPGDKALDWDRAEYAANPERALKRRNEWWAKVFNEETARIEKSYEEDKDFLAWTVDFVVYGLFLADVSVLDGVENELVTLSLVMGQGAYYTTMVHLRGTRRIGVNAADAEAIQGVIEMVAQHQGKDTSSWPRFKEVE